ncbi:MAG TPA: SDR family oxidoreductase, partial [Roseomonas sp.]|nr:SDR family oxidoreductase [Roseomonas sp.]
TEGMFARLRPGENNPAERIAKANPMRRVGTPADIGDLAAFLLSPIWINGETIALDGGGWLTGGGGFQDYLAWGDAEWDEARARIRARNEADKAKRS